MKTLCKFRHISQSWRTGPNKCHRWIKPELQLKRYPQLKSPRRHCCLQEIAWISSEPFKIMLAGLFGEESCRPPDSHQIVLPPSIHVPEASCPSLPARGHPLTVFHWVSTMLFSLKLPVPTYYLTQQPCIVSPIWLWTKWFTLQPNFPAIIQRKAVHNGISQKNPTVLVSYTYRSWLENFHQP